MGQVTHKMSYSKVYRTWIAMLSRCRNENEPNYVNYGGRGIKVCEEWYKFEKFYEDMGDLPFYDAQLDRIDNEKGYSKDNCRWISAKENSRNRRTTKKHKTHSGDIVQIELIEKIGWNKNQFTWFRKRYGIAWILDNFKNGTLPERTKQSLDKEEIVGKKFGKWIVLKFVSYIRGEGNRYLCKCECGLEKEVVGYYLRTGKSTQCRKCSYQNQKNKPNTKF